MTELSPEGKVRFQKTVAPMYKEYCSGYVGAIGAIMEAGDDGEQQGEGHR